MPLIARLIDFVSDIIGPDPREPSGAALDDRTLAVAALLVHVARVDGAFAPSEHDRVVDMLRRQIGLTEEAATRLLGRAERLDHEVDDIATLVEMLGHRVPIDERRNLLAMAYGVAGADGPIAEFEEDLVWRMAGLLGFDDSATEAVRADVLAGRTPSQRERT